MNHNLFYSLLDLEVFFCFFNEVNNNLSLPICVPKKFEKGMTLPYICFI